MRALSGYAEPSADMQSPQQFLSSRLLAGPLNLSSQVLVERLPSHCRIVWGVGQRRRHGFKGRPRKDGQSSKGGLALENSLPWAR